MSHPQSCGSPVSVLYRGSAIPVAWAVLPGNAPGPWLGPILRLLRRPRPAVPPGWTVLVLADRGLWSPRLWKRVRRLGRHPLLRIQRRTTITPDGGERRAAGALVRPGEAWVGRGALGGREGRGLTVTLVAAWTRTRRSPGSWSPTCRPRRVGVGWYASRMWIEIVFTQMTKRHPLAGRVERDGVADLDLAVGDQHAVDQQLDELPLPREVGAGQARPNPPAEVGGRGRPAGELGPPVHLRLQLVGLPAQRLEPLLQRLPAALVLGQRDDGEQVGLGQPLQLPSRPRRPWRSCSRRACSSCGSQPPPCARAKAWAIDPGSVSSAHRSRQTSASSRAAGA